MLAAACVLIFTACAPRKKIVADPDLELESFRPDIAGWVLQLENTTNMEGVGLGYARNVYQNYRNKMKRRIERSKLSTNRSRPLKGQQTKYIWVSYNKLKDFMCTLDSIQIQLAQNQKANVSGVRIYFGTYKKDDDSLFRRNKLTVVMCGTYLNPKDSVNYDIIYKKNKKKFIAALTVEENGYYNHGHLCPPKICPGALLDQ